MRHHAGESPLPAPGAGTIGTSARRSKGGAFRRLPCGQVRGGPVLRWLRSCEAPGELPGGSAEAPGLHRGDAHLLFSPDAGRSVGRLEARRHFVAPGGSRHSRFPGACHFPPARRAVSLCEAAGRFSRPHHEEVLPALPGTWPRGDAGGIKQSEYFGHEQSCDGGLQQLSCTLRDARQHHPRLAPGPAAAASNAKGLRHPPAEELFCPRHPIQD
mmetsp:Transcript_5020/g.11695  ORF Transcript_5020/g.11695 Transcript_5020/m.11695 type:complete len:214 (-) Transcript_5020:839-1480(-)